MATRINRIKILASNSSTRVRLVVAHGVLLPDTHRAPSGTYIIFLSKPGHLLAQDMLLQYPQLFNSRYLRRVFRGEIPVARIQPPPLRTWKSRFYGPGDIYPNMNLSLYDLSVNGTPTPGSQYNFVTGVHSLNNGSKGMYGQTKTLHDIVTHYGAGIYIVSACRASSGRFGPNRTGPSWTQLNRNYYLSGGAQTYVPRMRQNDPALNREIQRIENAQARYAAFKRSRSTTTARTNSRPTKIKFRTPRTPFAPGMTFTYAPGVNTTRHRKRA